MTPGGLRDELEALYRRLKKALESRDLPVTLSVLETDPAGPLTPEAWEELAASLEDDFPAFQESRIAGFREAGEWAGLYLDVSPEDPECVTLQLILFHRTAAGWKVSAMTAGAVVPRPASAAEQEGEIDRQIRTHPHLALPGES